ncbi:rhamnulose-1-phosphate aldolase [Salipaludibacillus sp. HK11]|uniref:rhamnulose-1-phosphate aldolase n=1 Tax=Salipaludibacillus sp. HK11 TaxID=3394320 RepID=UPI0039FDA4D5
MMSQILRAPFVEEMKEVTTNLYDFGWDERNGGNVSYLLDEADVMKYIDVNVVKREIAMNFDASELAGKYFIVTGSGKYFRNVKNQLSNTLGIIRISQDGKAYELLWGFDDGGVATSELPTHLMNHAARLKVDPAHRVVIHTHATNLIAMTFTHSLDERLFSRTLWQMCTECVVVFPEGVGIVPWMVPGTDEIGEATSKKLAEDNRIVLWPHHGVYGTGQTMDETFGLIETAEKAAEVFTVVRSQGEILQTISDQQLLDLAERFNVTPKSGYLTALSLK